MNKDDTNLVAALLWRFVPLTMVSRFTFKCPHTDEGCVCLTKHLFRRVFSPNGGCIGQTTK